MRRSNEQRKAAATVAQNKAGRKRTRLAVADPGVVTGARVDVGMLVYGEGWDADGWATGVVVEVSAAGVWVVGLEVDGVGRTGSTGKRWAIVWEDLLVFSLQDADARRIAKESSDLADFGVVTGVAIEAGMLVVVDDPNIGQVTGVVVETSDMGAWVRFVAGGREYQGDVRELVGTVRGIQWEEIMAYPIQCVAAWEANHKQASADIDLPVKVGDTVVVTTPQGLLDDAQVLSIADDGCFARTADGEVAGFTWDFVDIPARPELVRADMEVRLVVNDDACETGTVIETTEQGVFVRIGGGQTVSGTWDEVELSVAEWLKHRQQADKADANLELAAVGA